MADPHPSRKPGMSRGAGGVAFIVAGATLQLIQLGIITGDRTLLVLGMALLVG